MNEKLKGTIPALLVGNGWFTFCVVVYSWYVYFCWDISFCFTAFDYMTYFTQNSFFKATVFLSENGLT